jgi:hypothetical protein
MDRGAKWGVMYGETRSMCEWLKKPARRVIRLLEKVK